MEKIVKSIPIIAAFLVFFGFLKLYFYYSMFEINILDFLEFSEILTSFLDDLGSIITSLLLVLLYLVFVTKIASTIIYYYKKRKTKVEGDEAIKTKTEDKTNNKWTSKKATKGFKLIAVFMLGIFASILYYGYHYRGLESDSSFWTMNLAVVLFILTFFSEVIAWNKFKDTEQDDKKFATVGIMMLLSILFFFVFSLAHRDYLDMQKDTRIYELTLDNGEVVSSTEDLKLIGKTRNYYFFSDINSKENLIIPVSEVKNYYSYFKVDCKCKCD